LFRVFLSAVVALFAASGVMAYAYFHSSYWNRIGMAPAQPVLFSHRHHAAELRIDCRNCHSTVESSAFAGMPSTQACLACHSQIFTQTSMIQPLVQSAVTNVPLQWDRVNQLPAHVYFNHGVHISKGVACVTCHGEVGKMALTVKGTPLTMRWCLDCHRDPAPRLSPPSEIFEPVFAAGHLDANRRGLAAFYHLKTDSLTDCSTCHH
jgi:formate-dependent nitrite reductase cytochrome c552 subunit